MRGTVTALLGIWLGAMLMLMVTARVIFDRSPDRQLSGDLVGALLTPYHFLGLGLGALALVLWLLGKNKGLSGKTVPVLLVLSLAVVLINEFPMHSKIAEMRREIRQLEAETGKTPDEMKKKFGKIHGMSMGLNLLMFVMVGSTLVVVVRGGEGRGGGTS